MMASCDGAGAGAAEAAAFICDCADTISAIVGERLTQGARLAADNTTIYDEPAHFSRAWLDGDMISDDAVGPTPPHGYDLCLF